MRLDEEQGAQDDIVQEPTVDKNVDEEQGADQAGDVPVDKSEDDTGDQSDITVEYSHETMVHF